MLRSAFILSALTLTAAPAMADPENWAVSCAFSSPGPWDGSMTCNEGKVLPISAPNLGQKMNLRIGAPTTHCSDVTYVIYRFPDHTPIAQTRRLAPGEDQILELGEGWAEEGHISVEGIGHVGGCNVGEMHSWGALTEIFLGEPGSVASTTPAVLVENRFAVECGASTPYEVYPGVASVMCDRRIPVDFISPGPGHDIEITVAAPDTHCSTVTYFVNRPGTSFTFGMTERLAPGTSVTLGLGNEWPAGPQTVDIGAVGYVDGCNVGEIHSWGVDVRLMSLN